MDHNEQFPAWVHLMFILATPFVAVFFGIIWFIESVSKFVKREK